MRLTVIGTGYVGLVTGACFADAGHEVLCVDTNIKKISNLKKNILPIYEEGLEKIVNSNIKKKRLMFTSSYKQAAKFSKIIFIAVDTPPKKNGQANLESIEKFCDEITKYLNEDKILVEKSTVPVGTSKYISKRIKKNLNKLKKDFNISIVSNPEFLREGNAIEDFTRPDRIIVGSDIPEHKQLFAEIYQPFNRKFNKLIFMSVEAAELTKYAANSFLATKISFMNELSRLSDKLKIDIEDVRKGIGSDPRIGKDFLYPGCGYGGSCFPKDISALKSIFKASRVQSSILDAVDTVNKQQKSYILQKLKNHYKTLKGKTITIWGLTFKPKTDDIRFAPSIEIIDLLLKNNVKIQAYDPVGSLSNLFTKNYREYSNAIDALKHSDALVICTEWREFWSIDPKIFKKYMKSACIFDGRNIYSPEKMQSHGISYFGIGRGL